jgi:hypothetical protein
MKQKKNSYTGMSMRIEHEHLGFARKSGSWEHLKELNCTGYIYPYIYLLGTYVDYISHTYKHTIGTKDTQAC